jgi:hypothetical protein
MTAQQKEKNCIHKLLTAGNLIFSRIASPLLAFGPIQKSRSLVHILRPGVWIIRGCETLSKQRLTVLYAGSDEEIEKSFFTGMLFDGPIEEQYIKKSWLWNTTKVFREHSNGCSLVVAEIPAFLKRFYQRDHDFLIPFWVKGEADCSLPMTRTVKSDLQKIKKSNMSFEITKEASWFDEFYYGMHVPHITAAHGHAAIIETYDSMKDNFKHGELLLLLKENVAIGGMLLCYSKSKAYLYVLGIKDGNMQYISEGAIGAMYYFAIQYIKEKGYRKANLGESRAFLRYGVLQFKKKRNMQIYGISNMLFYLKPIQISDSLKGLLINCPFILLNHGKLEGAIFMANDHTLTIADLKQIFNCYYLPGISKLVVYSIGAIDSNLLEKMPSEYAGKIEVRPADSVLTDRAQI